MRVWNHQLWVLIIVLVVALFHAEAKKPSRPSRSVSGAAGTTPPRSRSSSSRGTKSGRPPVSKRKPVVEDDEDEDGEMEDAEIDDDFDVEDSFGAVDDEEEEEAEDEFEEDDLPPRRSSSTSSKKPSRRTPPAGSRPVSRSRQDAMPPKRRGPPRKRYEDEEEEEEEDYPPPRSRTSAKRSSAGTSRRPPPSAGRRGPPPRRGGRPGSVVPYTRQPAGPTAFLQRLGESMPDTTALREAAAASVKAARETTSSLSSNIYRDLKGLTSSELEQVMLKATKPDDTPAKGKHVERLVGVTYQISPRYDIYDAVLRKLWGKMCEKDWRTTMKALYVLHRFSADGAPEHAASLKARLRELRRTKDPKRKDKFFNSKQLLAGDAKPENIKFRAFMSRYAHYVLLRAQCFSGMFEEISSEPKVDKKKPPKPITSTALRTEHLEAASMLLKAGLACQLKDGEECENTAIAVERVASDLIGLTSAVAMALNRALKDVDLKGGDPALVKKWCEFYSEQLLPQTKSMVKKTSSRLDAYGLFLPSRMGTSVSRELLSKGLNLDTEAGMESIAEEEDEEGGDATDDASKSSSEPSVEKAEEAQDEDTVDAEPEADEDEEVEDEYEYEEEEYYDDEDE
eukprot:scaffold3608_cov183-Amphora_coffeaeformis.AAC.27